MIKPIHLSQAQRLDLEPAQALDTQTIEFEIIVEGLSLAIVDGVKLLFDTNQNGFHNASICPSISHDIVLLAEWIVRGLPSKQDAFHHARTCVAAKLYGFSLLHCDSEGRIGLFPNPIHHLTLNDPDGRPLCLPPLLQIPSPIPPFTSASLTSSLYHRILSKLGKRGRPSASAPRRRHAQGAVSSDKSGSPFTG